jgi:hypothetical protein
MNYTKFSIPVLTRWLDMCEKRANRMRREYGMATAEAYWRGKARSAETVLEAKLKQIVDLSRKICRR